MARLAVVTGTRGLGLETAKALARSGHDVILAGRNPAQGGEAAAAIGRQAAFARLDLANLASIRDFAADLNAAGRPVDILLNNAGVMSPPQRRLTDDGFELQFGVNYLGHFALTAALLPLLRRAPEARVVSVTSLAMRFARPNVFDDPNSEKSYNPGLAYCRSKLFQAMFAQGLQSRSDAHGWNVTSLAAHPGFAATNLIAEGPGGMQDWLGKYLIGPLFGQPAAAGALPSVHAATAPDVVPGGLYGPKGFFEMKGKPGRCEYSALAADRDAIDRLWELTESLLGQAFQSASG